jgi:hypothetical protein
VIDRSSPPHVLYRRTVGPSRHPGRVVMVRTRERGRAVAAQRKGADTPSYLRAAEVADILHVLPKTVFRWALADLGMMLQGSVGWSCCSVRMSPGGSIRSTARGI